jgi:hypothetical protein
VAEVIATHHVSGVNACRTAQIGIHRKWRDGGFRDAAAGGSGCTILIDEH